MSKQEVITLKDLEEELSGYEKDLAEAKTAKDKEKIAQVEEQINAVNESIKTLKTSAAVWKTEEEQRIAEKKKNDSKAAAAKQIQDAKNSLTDQPVQSSAAKISKFTPIAPVNLFFPESFWSKELDRSIKHGPCVVRTKEEYDVLSKRALKSNLKK